MFEQVIELVCVSFGDWKVLVMVLFKVLVIDGCSILFYLLVIDQDGVGQVGVVVVYVVLLCSDVDFYVGMVVNVVFGGLYLVCFNEEICIKCGLFYGVSSSFDLCCGSGLWLVVVQIKNLLVIQVVMLMQGEFDCLGLILVGVDELVVCKVILVGEYGCGLEIMVGLVVQVGELVVYGVDLVDIGCYIECVQVVIFVQIQCYVQVYLGEIDWYVVVVGDVV